MGKLDGKVAIITGGGQGIGLGIARAFVKEGAGVLLSGRTLSTLKNAVTEIKGIGGRVAICAADVTKPEDAPRTIRTAVDELGGINILVNSAQGLVPPDPKSGKIGLQYVDEDEWRLTVESGLYGTYRHMVAAFPHLQKAGGGSIINFGSRSGIAGEAGVGAYAAAKEGIRGLSRSAARDWGRFGIRVNVINPAAMTSMARTAFANNPALEGTIVGAMALGYLGDPEEDIGRVAVFLASDDSRYVTGQTINADGGQAML